MDGVSRKEFWDELLRAVIVLSNAKVYAEYATRVKALTAATAVASQPLPNSRQQKLNLQQQQQQQLQQMQQHPGTTPSPCFSSVATQTAFTSPSYRWRRGSSNSSSSTASAGAPYLRRSSAVSTSTGILPFGEMEYSGCPYESPSANTWCYIRRLSAVSACSVDSAAAYPSEDTTRDRQCQTDDPVLFLPKTVLPPALNEMFPVTAYITMLRPLMSPRHNLHIKLYLLEGELLKALRNPFACYYPSRRFRARGLEYQAYREKAITLGAASPAAGQQVYSSASDSPRQQQQEAGKPVAAAPHADKEEEPSEDPAFTGLVTLRLSEDLTSGLIAGCRERNMTMNGLVTTAAAVALSRMLWRRNQVMQQHNLLADLSRVAAASSAASCCWPLRHHSLWASCPPQNQREQQLLKTCGEDTPQEGTCVQSTEHESLATTLNSTCASSEQDSAKAGTPNTTQTLSPSSCETYASHFSKGSAYTCPAYPSDLLESPSVSPLERAHPED
ncbi:uncharacterized protein EMH_0082290 [Eimeria mitis]|uniref:Uncharacterized protein n=1 Tax=Eimeria mitis TaxID=44415 RepID=U6KD53_9EIME|nr:uncharacterized protein EMH_0082290 [Eimeria mitis]CDJ33393.1 hypothetical protein, conserved [Eimeria mitis]